MKFIKVRSSEGVIYVNVDKVEMVAPKKFGEANGCTLRMNEKLFIKVYESAEDIIERLNK